MVCGSVLGRIGVSRSQNPHQSLQQTLTTVLKDL